MIRENTSGPTIATLSGMTRLAPIVALVVAFSGCATTRGRAAGTVAAIAGAVTVVDVAAQRDAAPSDQPIEQAAPQLYVLGALVLVPAIAGLIAADAEMSNH